MSYAAINVTSDGTGPTIAVPWGYLSTAHVYVTVNGSLYGGVKSWDSPALLRLTPFPAASAKIAVYRVTPVDTARKSFQAGPIPPKDLNEQVTQLLYRAQELTDLQTRAVMSALGDAQITLPSLTGNEGKYFTVGPGGTILFASGSGADGALRADMANTSLGARLLGFLRSGSLIATNVNARIEANEPLMPHDFGAVCNPATTVDTVAMARMCLIASAIYSAAGSGLLAGAKGNIYIPACAGILIDATLNLSGGVNWVQEPGAAIIVRAGATTPIVGINYYNPHTALYEAPRDVDSVFDIRRETAATWTSVLEADKALYIQALYASRVHVRRADNFGVGVDACMGYGKLLLGDIRGNKRGLIIDTRAAAGPMLGQFTNELTITGGSFTRPTAAANTGQNQYGIEVRDTGVQGVNTIRGKDQSFELNVSPAANRTHFFNGNTGNVGNCIFEHQRAESMDSPLVYGEGSVTGCRVGFIGNEVELSKPEVLFFNETLVTAGFGNRVYRETGPLDPLQYPAVIFQSGPLAKRAVAATGGHVTIKNLMCAFDAGAAPGTQPFVDYAFGGGVTFNADGTANLIAAGRFMGVGIRTNGCRSFALRAGKTANTSSTGFILAYDSAGNQLQGAGKIGGYDAIHPYTYQAGSYRGFYNQGLQIGGTADDGDLAVGFFSLVDPAIAFVFVSVTPCKWFEVLATDPRPQWESLTRKWENQYQARAIPIALTNVAYEPGMVVINSLGDTGLTPDWQLNPGGTTWRPGANRP